MGIAALLQLRIPIPGLQPRNSCYVTLGGLAQRLAASCKPRPELVVGPEIYWRVPVQYAPSRRGPLGIVGHLLVNAETGEISIADGQTAEDLMERAEALYARATL